jgi:23S rRNA maturation-related 3'-5' exoribonuclease YhaM
MEPIRKSDGYTLEGVKKYKRYFLINKKSKTNTSNSIKKIDLILDDDIEDINETIIEKLFEE